MISTLILEEQCKLVCMGGGGQEMCFLLRWMSRGVVKAFEMAAIEDNGATKTATNGALSNRILCNLLDGNEITPCSMRGSSLL